MAKNKILPFFIPHIGCPHRCIFCDQNAITGKTFDVQAIHRDLAVYFADETHAGTQIAFFGGSFTAIDRDLMEMLLCEANVYIQRGMASGIRISTRPDAVEDEMLILLKQYGVTHVELGIQSISDDVLTITHRGHCAAQSVAALQRVVSHGLIAGGQMMVGLPLSDAEKELETARVICRCGAKESRIYPTAVFPHTPLYSLYKRGEYSPLSLEAALERCVPLYEEFLKNDVTVLRIGLCENESLHKENEMPIGPMHPAFGELVLQAEMKRKIDRALEGEMSVAGKKMEITVPEKSISCLTGHGGIKPYLYGRYAPTSIDFIADAAMTDKRGVKIVLKDH